METLTSDQVRSEIRNIVARVTERELEEIGDKVSFIEELEVDSLMAMEIMITIDRKFRIQVPEEEFSNVKNLDESVALVVRCLHDPEFGGQAVA